ncbi:hypothetical protein D9M72_622900 [compost metagenome]
MLDPLLRPLCDLKPNLDGLVLPRSVDRQNNVSKLCGGVHEEVQMDVELQALQCLSCPQRISLGDEQVIAESHEPTDRVGLP